MKRQVGERWTSRGVGVGSSRVTGGWGFGLGGKWTSHKTEEFGQVFAPRTPFPRPQTARAYETPV